MILENNLEALSKYQPLFTLPEEYDKGNFEFSKGADGRNNIKCIHNGQPLYIHNETDAVLEAKKQTDSIELRGNGLIVSFGLGMGYEAREIIKKMDKGTNFIIMEPSAEILSIVLENEDIADIASAANVHLLSYREKSEAIEYMRRFVNRSNYKNLAVFVINTYVTLFFEMCRDLMFVMDDFRMSFELSDATVQRFTELWQKNVILNFRHYLNSYLVADFFGKFTGIPAIVVSAGPSLSKNIEGLKNIKDKCLIISVDTALKPLFNNGIKPHFVVSLDTQDIVYRKFEGLCYDDIPLIYIPTSSPPVLDNHRGTKIISIVQDNFYKNQMTELSKNTAIFELGGSVSTSAFSFAQLAGCDPIILVGQDLAFTDMKSHAKGTAFEEDIGNDRISNLFVVNGADGTPVYTDGTLLTYITWFQTYVASDTSNRVYIDATEGGAKLLGFKDMTLKDVVETYLNKEGVNALVLDAFEKASLLEAAEKKHILKNYKIAISFIESIKTDADKASKQLSHIGSLLKKPVLNPAAINAAYSRISTFERKIQQNTDKLELLSITLAPLAEKLNLAFENSGFKSELERQIFAAESYSEYYGEIAKCCNSLLPLFKERTAAGLYFA